MMLHSRRFQAGAALLSVLIAGAPLGCGGDDPSNPPPPPPPPPAGTEPMITRFEANLTRVAPMGRVTLTWAVTNADKVSIAATPGGALVTDSTMLTGMIESG